MFIFFHTILTVAQNTCIAYLTIIPECYIVYLFVFSHLCLPWGYFVQPEGGILKLSTQ